MDTYISGIQNRKEQISRDFISFRAFCMASCREFPADAAPALPPDEPGAGEREEAP